MVTSPLSHKLIKTYEKKILSLMINYFQATNSKLISATPINLISPPQFFVFFDIFDIIKKIKQKNIQ